MTGTFDNWTKTEQLEKVGQIFQKTVTLPESSDKIYYKVGDIVSFCLSHRVWVSPGACLRMGVTRHFPQSGAPACSGCNGVLMRAQPNGGQLRGMEQRLLLPRHHQCAAVPVSMAKNRQSAVTGDHPNQMTSPRYWFDAVPAACCVTAAS